MWWDDACAVVYRVLLIESCYVSFYSFVRLTVSKSYGDFSDTYLKRSVFAQEKPLKSRVNFAWLVLRDSLGVFGV